LSRHLNPARMTTKSKDTQQVGSFAKWSLGGISSACGL
jgi:hypothetical protein